MKEYLYSYKHNGAEYNFTLQAEDWTDARNRVNSIYHTVKLDGEVAEKIPVNVTTHFLVDLYVRLKTWLKNK